MGFSRKKSKKTLLIVSASVFFAALIFIGPRITVDNDLSVDGVEMTLFYSPQCACCVKYLPYLKRNGFLVSEERDLAKRVDILEENRISPEMSSCHTGIVEGYFVEGHIPAEVIAKLLEERPEIDGISLPGMPQGTPGMPGPKVEEWTIYGFSGGEVFEYTKL